MSAAQPGSINRASKWRGVADFYPTPPGATQALCNLGILPHAVWEPACGNGAMARVLRGAGHSVIATDLTDYGYGMSGLDFLATDELQAPAIVTNPPFRLANEFVSHALDLGPDIAAFFLRLKFLEGATRYRDLLEPRPPAEIHVFIERVKFFSGDHAAADQPGWNTEAFAWFIWRRGIVQAPTVHWLRRDSTPRLSDLSFDTGIFA